MESVLLQPVQIGCQHGGTYQFHETKIIVGPQQWGSY
jgi:hypothetical protein